MHRIGGRYVDMLGRRYRWAKPPGRRTRMPGEHSVCHVTVRLTRSEKRTCRAAARRVGLRLTEFIREAINEGVAGTGLRPPCTNPTNKAAVPGLDDAA